MRRKNHNPLPFDGPLSLTSHKVKHLTTSWMLSAHGRLFVRLATLGTLDPLAQAFWWSCSVAPRGWSNFILAVANATPLDFVLALPPIPTISDGEAKGADTAPTLDAATLERCCRRTHRPLRANAADFLREKSERPSSIRTRAERRRKLN